MWLNPEAVSAQRHRTLVPVATEGDRLPLLVAHGMQCDPTFAQILGKFTGPARPLLAFQGIGLRGDVRPHTTIQDMAAAYIREARDVQPSGPYALAGFCVGGHVAMEMANQLLDVGQEVKCLFLIDTPIAGPDIINAAIAAQIELARQRLAKFPDKIESLAGAPDTIAGLGQALLTYVARPFRGKAQIFTNERMLPLIFDRKLGWRELLPASTAVFPIAPDHEAILRRAPLIAKLINEALTK